MNTDTYNGWTNFETWNVNLTYEHVFSDMASNQYYSTTPLLAKAMETFVEQMEFDPIDNFLIAKNLIGAYLDKVNWEEIAGHYNSHNE